MDSNTEPGTPLADGVLVIRALAQDAHGHVFRISAEVEPDGGPDTRTVAEPDDVLKVVSDWLTSLTARSN